MPKLCWQNLPIFDTSARFHRLKFCSNVSHTTFNNIVEIYHWCPAN